ncbi:hypothetical protein ACFW2Y_26465 [Streptomyces sp. NPDC058877]|uniref:hypothetical protein n=1 Tax=Streptomyces sp. NPDC058877 TaxID=3346665 RepID=UPI003680258A
MLEHPAATAPTRPVTVLHADRSPADHALRADTDRLISALSNARATFWYERDAEQATGSRTGPMNLETPELPVDANVYPCGPFPFMREVGAQLLPGGIPARNIRYEVFGPDPWLADTTP